MHPLYPPLVGLQTIFLREIKLFARYSIETTVMCVPRPQCQADQSSAWDGQWVYFLHRFLIAPAKSGIATTDANGKPRCVLAPIRSRLTL